MAHAAGMSRPTTPRDEEGDHPAIGRNLQEDLRRELEQEARRQTPSERENLESVAHDLKRKALSDVEASEREDHRVKKIERVYALVDYVFFVVYGLIGLMIGLELLGARDWSAFMRFMRLITAPILAPFKGVMPDPKVGSMQLMLSYILAVIVYAFLHKALKGLFQLVANRRAAKL